ncbi:hypothetical protein AKJ37_07960 [candidate division MSBL1 archaeon SCGC-AAA259I09]|uniref:DUF424 domain-containing protein n=2 Tax=candidate division MSBL1 TaxID=215777 RepID=A0A133UIT3_9EURY|nr:hypothetical protein AKJ37_07960 [candidate division MSBL1 archaeon SCGC-AAA259I09]KXA97219.1 hypothetical protein AKJ39_03545 [candidate division MSBL1 archaeon SCGC-AAA259J03]
MPHLTIKKKRGETIVAICDEELFGKKFQENNLKLEVDRSFYEGEKTSVEECLNALEEATIANLVGSIVEHAIDAGYINPENVLRIEDIPHAQMVRP